MNYEIRYYSKGGNTKKLADAISEVLKVRAKTMQDPIMRNADILFIGASIYASKVDVQVKKFIAAIDPKKVKKAVIFSTAALKKSAYPEMEKLLKAQGIMVEQKEFHCRGAFSIIHKGRPNEKDLNAAKEFAKQFI